MEQRYCRIWPPPTVCPDPAYGPALFHQGCLPRPAGAAGLYYAVLNRRPSQPRWPTTSNCGKTRHPLLGQSQRLRQSASARLFAEGRHIPCSRNRVARHMRAMHLKARQKRGLQTPKPPMPTIPIPSPPTGSGRSVAPRGPTGSGSPTSPISPPPKAGFTPQPSWTFTAGRSSDGPPATHWKHRLVKAALQQALTSTAVPLPGPLHHSDRGSQYASSAFRTLLHSSRLCPSMAGRRRQLLRQRRHGILLEHTQNRMAAPQKLPDPPSRPLRRL